MGIFNKSNNSDDAPEASNSAGIPALSVTPALVDTSVLIDARILDIAKAGFAPGRLLIPRFVLHELQNIADSSDAMRRGRGRRGLEALTEMRSQGVDMDVLDDDYPEIAEVDAKLVRLAREIKANVLTTDYNLNRVASIEGVRVLNINELANAVRPVILPGEKMVVKVVQPGKEKGQGVGYLADGTMIVVDQGDKLIGQEVPCEITRVFQTVAGKMLFAVPVGVKAGSIDAVAPKGKPVPKNGSPKPAREQRGPRGPKPQLGEQKGPRAPRGPRAEQQTAPRPPRATKPQAGNDAGDRSKSPRKRLSPTQRLENSLMELTKADE